MLNKEFKRPEMPFLLIYEDIYGDISYTFQKTEDDVLNIIKEIESYDCVVIEAIEINSSRKIY